MIMSTKTLLAVVEGLTAIRETLESLGIDPRLAALFAAIGLLLVGYTGVRLIAHYRHPGRKLHRLLRGYETVAIVMHPNPDPDAMGAALGVEAIAESADTEATIYYVGQIRHHENRAFQTVLDLDFERIETLTELTEEATVLVDHNRPRGPGAESISPTAVIDHHPGDGVGTRLTDVRPEYGACATIIAEYLEALGFTPVGPDSHTNDDRDLSVTTATGLLYGIQTDTEQLTNGAMAADFAMIRYLYPGIDHDLLRRIANPPIDGEILEIKARAIENIEIDSPYAYAWVGDVSNLDSIPQAADELISLEGISTVVVAGEHEEMIHLSGRSHDDRVHIGKVLDTLAEEIPDSSAGGHARMAGGQLAAAHVDGDLGTRLFKAIRSGV